MSIVSKDLDKELYSFPDMMVDEYIIKCVKARKNVFDKMKQKNKALKWLVKQRGFINSFGEVLNDYLNKITKEQVIRLLTQDIQSYYQLYQTQLDISMNMDIYQLQEKYQEKAITYAPYQEGCYTNSDYAGFANYFIDKKLLELMKNLCVFYSDWLSGLYKRKADYITSGLGDLKKA